MTIPDELRLKLTVAMAQMSDKIQTSLFLLPIHKFSVALLSRITNWISSFFASHAQTAASFLSLTTPHLLVEAPYFQIYTKSLIQFMRSLNRFIYKHTYNSLHYRCLKIIAAWQQIYHTEIQQNMWNSLWDTGKRQFMVLYKLRFVIDQ